MLAVGEVIATRAGVVPPVAKATEVSMAPCRLLLSTRTAFDVRTPLLGMIFTPSKVLAVILAELDSV